ncbi:MAG: translation initiation factor IF-2, partial [Parachlamydiales bacterium]
PWSVVAGDEGMREQTMEALNQAKAAKVPIVVAINKSDKQGYDPEKVYRQLADQELLPEAWGGATITVNCSATTKEGLSQLLELLSLQAEILELKALPSSRARGTVLESQMHKGLGPVATILVQNGTLKLNDAIVFGSEYGRVKTMYDQFGKAALEAGPSTPVKITGLSGLAEAGDEFIVVGSEKEAKALAEDRAEGQVRDRLKKSTKGSLEALLKKQGDKKFLPLIIKADVQGSLEALIAALKKLPSDKVEINLVKAEVGEISESDLMLANASHAQVIGFHTKIEGHAAHLINTLGVKVYLHDIIYHAIDEIKRLMIAQLSKIPVENDTGKAEVKALFKSSLFGTIAGCQVIDGIIKRGQMARILRNDEIIFKGKIASLKRVKEDVKEVLKGLECGILIDNFSDFQEKDLIQTYDITYLEPEL